MFFAYCDSSVRRKTVKPIAPSHWFSVPPNEQYTRVTLVPSSGEFKDVEKLFNERLRSDRKNRPRTEPVHVGKVLQIREENHIFE